MAPSRRTFLVSLPALLVLACADDFAGFGEGFDLDGWDYAGSDPIGMLVWAYDESDSIPVPDHLAWQEARA
jgi:hypothetical protein